MSFGLAVRKVLGPLVLLLFAVSSQWSISYILPEALFQPPHGDVYSHLTLALSSAGVAIRITNIVLLVSWLLPLGFCVYSTYFVARYWPIVDAQSRPLKRISGAAATRQRRCAICDTTMDLRTEHCTRLGRCLPLYDHYCLFLHVVVWSHNLKAFLALVVLLPLHQLFCFAVAVWGLTVPELRHTVLRDLLFVLPTVLVLSAFFSISAALGFWIQLVAWNCTDKEMRARTAHFRLENEDCPFEVNYHADDLWNLGWRGNFSYFFGRWYQVPLFFLPGPGHTKGVYPLNPAYTGVDNPLGNVRQILERRRVFGAALEQETGLRARRPHTSEH